MYMHMQLVAESPVTGDYAGHPGLCFGPHAEPHIVQGNQRLALVLAVGAQDQDGASGAQVGSGGGELGHLCCGTAQRLRDTSRERDKMSVSSHGLRGWRWGRSHSHHG